MDEKYNAAQVAWGARINARARLGASDCPAWAKPLDRDRWIRQGLVVWQQETQHIIQLSATQALAVLDDLRTDDAWTEKGIVIGEPTTRIPLGGPKQEPGEALWNPIRLSPRQAKAVFGLLVRNEATLGKMSKEEKELRARTLGKVYRLLLRLAAEKDASRGEVKSE